MCTRRRRTPSPRRLAGTRVRSAICCGLLLGVGRGRGTRASSSGRGTGARAARPRPARSRLFSIVITNSSTSRLRVVVDRSSRRSRCPVTPSAVPIATVSTVGDAASRRRTGATRRAPRACRRRGARAGGTGPGRAGPRWSRGRRATSKLSVTRVVGASMPSLASRSGDGAAVIELGADRIVDQHRAQRARAISGEQLDARLAAPSVSMPSARGTATGALASLPRGPASPARPPWPAAPRAGRERPEVSRR